MFKKVLLFSVILLLTFVFALKQPQMLVIPLALLLYMAQSPIRSMLGKVNLAFAYIITGFILGMVVEIFAIWQNIGLPSGERKLFNPDPVHDLFIAGGFYLVVTIVLYYFVKRYGFSKKVFISTVVFYAIVVEQLGVVFIAGFTNPFLWLYVALVYSVWIITPFILFNNMFPGRPKPGVKVCICMLLVLGIASFIGSVIGNLIFNIF